MALLGLFLATFDWSGLHAAVGADAKLEVFNQVVLDAQEKYCPVEEFKVRFNKKFIVSAKLAKLSRLKSKEFRKNRYSTEFKALKKECDK